VAGHILNVGSVGSASVSASRLSVETKASLARCSWIFLSLDVDGPGAENARKWREVYPHKSRRVILPHGKDLNDFILQGGNLIEWLGELKSKLDRNKQREKSTIPLSIEPQEDCRPTTKYQTQDELFGAGRMAYGGRGLLPQSIAYVRAA